MNSMNDYSTCQRIDVFHVIRNERLHIHVENNYDELCIQLKLTKERIEICNKARSIYAQFQLLEIEGSMV
jgi:hypothetical protein